MVRVTLAWRHSTTFSLSVSFSLQVPSLSLSSVVSPSLPSEGFSDGNSPYLISVTGFSLSFSLSFYLSLPATFCTLQTGLAALLGCLRLYLHYIGDSDRLGKEEGGQGGGGGGGRQLPGGCAEPPFQKVSLPRDACHTHTWGTDSSHPPLFYLPPFERTCMSNSMYIPPSHTRGGVGG